MNDTNSISSTTNLADLETLDASRIGVRYSMMDAAWAHEAFLAAL
jgi:hypothetical protein